MRGAGATCRLRVRVAMPVRCAYATSRFRPSIRSGPAPKPTAAAPQGAAKTSAKSATQARRDDIRQRLEAEGAIETEVDVPPGRSMERKPMVQRAHGRPQTTPSVASTLYNSLIEQVKFHPDRVADPQLTQYLPDACALLVTTDLHLRETILHLLSLFSTSPAARQDVMARCGETLMHIADSPSSQKELLYAMLTLTNLTSDEGGADYYSHRGLAALAMNSLCRQPEPAPLKVRVTPELPTVEVGYPLPVRLSILHVLKNISHLPVNDQAFENPKFMQYMARSIRSPEDEEREMSLFLFTNMTALETNQTAAVKAGVLETLVAILRVNATDKMASIALANVSGSPEAASLAQKAGLVPLLMSYLTPLTNKELLVNALITLGNLCRDDKCREDMQNVGFTQRILQIITSGDDAAVEYGTWTLGKFLENDAKSKDMLWQTDAFFVLVDLLDAPDAVIRRNVTQAISLAVHKSPSNQKALADIEQSIEDLESICEDPEELTDTKKYAVLALGAIAGNESLFPVVERMDILRWMLRQLIVAKPTLQVAILLALSTAVNSYKSAVELASVDIDKVLLRLSSRKFASDTEQQKQQREAEEAAKRENRTPPESAQPNTEVSEIALAVLEKMDVVLQQNSGVGLEDVAPSRPLTK